MQKRVSETDVLDGSDNHFHDSITVNVGSESEQEVEVDRMD